jgi:hypothetical protein
MTCRQIFFTPDDPDRCIEHLRSLAALGLDKVAISGGARGAAADNIAMGKQLVAKYVLPGVKRGRWRTPRSNCAILLAGNSHLAFNSTKHVSLPTCPQPQQQPRRMIA